ncbi:Di-copper centre-containing protein [Rhizoclosmatium globosum]|uniref:Di-copper centre-containing protein n=1 Tax=Rhizoclosmatium globosum TaxID=329046 RepID=A0A1Y2BS97_9FUNG|nr:Di-copper centre-containing protein [Rhizoclosmatium globosum]|eukprot:ORY37632.1 Di-copper centre-containing protein [Rhizoclosmatium globosum]
MSKQGPVEQWPSEEDAKLLAVEQLQPRGGFHALRINTTLGFVCLDAENLIKDAVSVKQCDSESVTQKWFHSFGMIRNVGTGLCLDSKGGSGVWLQPCSEKRSQLWEIRRHFGNQESGLLASYNYTCIGWEGSSTSLVLQKCSDADPSTSTMIYGALSLERAPEKGTCSKLSVRKEYRDLTDDERNQFLRGLTLLREAPSLTGRANRYFDYVAVHGMATNMIHHVPVFFPWHRYYLNYLEEEMQTLLKNSSFALPYWSWSTHPSKLTSTLGPLSPEFLGTTGRPTPSRPKKLTGCVRDGLVSNWTALHSPCISRLYDPPQDRFNFSQWDHLRLAQELLLNENGSPWTDYEAFSTAFEVSVHGIVHTIIGGSFVLESGERVYGDMGSTLTAANDPIFFLHHGNVDRYYSAFQNLYPNVQYNGTWVDERKGDGKVSFVKSEDPLPTFGSAIVRDGMPYGRDGMCYRYEPYSGSAFESSVVQFQDGRPIVDGLGIRGDPLPNKVVNLVKLLDNGFGGSNVLQRSDADMMDVMEDKVNGYVSDWVLELLSHHSGVSIQKMKDDEEKKQDLNKVIRKQAEQCLNTYFGPHLAEQTHDDAVKVACAKIAVASVATGYLL